MEVAIKGIATILWCSVWADCAEKAKNAKGKRYPLSGQQIEDHAGEAPGHAYLIAERLRGRIEEVNGLGIASLYCLALKADCPDYEPETLDYHSDQAARFGECLAYMSMGAGVSWFDDHKEFFLKVPHTDYHHELEDLAIEHLLARGYVYESEG